MLSEATPLLAFVAKQLRNGEPADGLLQGLHASGDHARQRRRHLGPQRDVAVAFIAKCIQLLNDLVAALLRVHLERFEGRAVVFLKAVACGHTAPGRKDVVSEDQVFRVEIAEAGERFPLHHNNLAPLPDRRKTGQPSERVTDCME